MFGTTEGLEILDMVACVERDYVTRNPGSREIYQDACRLLPGGNTRSSLYYDPFPLTMARGEGAHLEDVDGHRYIDLLGDHTAGLFGHSHPVIIEAVSRALSRGIDFGAVNAFEAKLATAVCARFPSIEMVRFTNSGTEANLMAVSAARAITHREGIVVFDGAYHGGVFSFKGGGNPINAPFSFLVAKYNDMAATEGMISRNADNIAAVLIEPMLGAGGCIPARVAFLAMLREITTRHGIMLIFDEVMTSRLAPGGLQEKIGILPDMTTLGKYVGGGLTFGAFGGRAEIMEHFDVRKPNAFPHAGTFNNNVLTMSAALAGLSVYSPQVAVEHNGRGDALRDKLNSVLEKHAVNMQFTGLGSMMTPHMLSGPICSPADAALADKDLWRIFFFDMIRQGFWMSPGGLIALCLPITNRECDQFVNTVEDWVLSHRSLLRCHDGRANPIGAAK